jgi:hypothetical protein
MRDTLGDFGLPRGLAAVGTVVLSLAELTVAVLLARPTTARLGAVAAVAVLAVFSIAIGRVLLRGERPDCACFGRLHSAPVGPATLVRNVSFAAVAALVAAVGPGRGLGAALGAINVTPLGIVAFVLSVAAVLQAWFAWQLFRQHGRLLERLRLVEAGTTGQEESFGLQIGEPAPKLELNSHGGAQTLDDLLAPGRALALVFSDPDCGACAELAPRLEQVRASHASLEIALIEDDRRATEAYFIRTVPSAVIVDSEGRIASATVSGDRAVEDLLVWAAVQQAGEPHWAEAV